MISGRAVGTESVDFHRARAFMRQPRLGSPSASRDTVAHCCEELQDGRCCDIQSFVSKTAGTRGTLQHDSSQWNVRGRSCYSDKAQSGHAVRLAYPTNAFALNEGGLTRYRRGD
jgi:hypothetical protein